MEAGYDYLLVRRRFQRRLVRFGALFLVVLGVGLLVGGISFFVIFPKSTEELQRELDFTTQPGGEGLPTSPQGELATARDGEPGTPVPTPIPTPTPSPTPAPTPVATATPEPEPVQKELVLVRLPQGVISAARLYPGENLRAVFWDDPLAFEPLSSTVQDLINGFEPVDPAAAPPSTSLPRPSRLVIPSIDVDSRVEELTILNLGDSRAYETPKNVVGHIPETADPGEGGSTWLFGHLESPIRGEGNVFAQLPKIPSLLRNGEDVYSIVEAGAASYLYKVTETRVIPQEELRLFDTGTSSLVLVACVPRFVYDHRLLVTAELVGIRGA